MTIAISGTTGITLDGQFNSASSMGFKNRIINGAMVIDQRNAGASVTPTDGSYTLDRWIFKLTQTSKITVQQNAGSVTTQAGFPNYMGITSSSAYSINSTDIFSIRQSIEGYNFADLAFGTASASTVTLSFWVRSSLTGTFGGSLTNYNASRSYPFSYTISSANTWEQKSVTIAGDTSGTWVGSSNAGAASVWFGLGVGSTNSGTAGSWASADYRSATGATSVVGTNGATFYITGVQLEKGSTATSFDYRPYGTELALCQRYFEKSYDLSATPGTVTTNGQSYWVAPASLGRLSISFQTKKRTVPTIILYSPATGASGNVRDVTVGADVATSAGNTGEQATLSIYSSTASREYSQHWTASAEL
jgi:hypothetical protein